MKKLMALILVVLSVAVFADLQRVSDVKQKPGQKGWIDYSGTPAYLFDDPFERAIYYDVEDFGMEYPVDFYAVQAYVYTGGTNYHFKIYDKDGVTVLWESADSLSVDNSWEVTEPDAPVVLADDFWISMVPQADGSPTIVFDDADGPLGSNSYYGDGAGNWGSLETAFEAPHNFSMLVYVEPTAQPDVFAPLMREMTGSTAFMDTDMNVVLRLTDQSPIVTPVVGDYSIDGGTTWQQFNLDTLVTGAKGTLNVVGAIPGQVDGTVGAVRFNLVDSIGNSAVTDEYEISWSKDNPMLSESFEGVFPPVGWSLVTSGAGWIQFDRDGAYVNVRTGDHCAAHMDDSGAQDSWLVSPVLNIPATNSCTFSFWQVGLWIDYLNYHEVAITTDGGTTWNTIYTDDDVNNPDIEYDHTQEMFTLGAYAGQSIQIGWRYVGDYTDQWYIDDVEVLYDYEGPTIVDIVGNEALRDSVGIGAFLNNDLTVSITANDLTGVQSITGHYSYDGGTTWTDVVFAAAKAGDELWTGVVPAEAAAIQGIINFDMVDLGGIASPTTMDYTFDFVGDGDAAVFKYVTGTETFVNNPMNLEIVFTDESAITSCSGAYSKDGWVTQYDFELTPSKVHEYTYVGTIPAETEEILDGEVIFTIGDAAGNFMQTDPANVRWRDGQIEYWQDFETDYSDWYFGGNWGVVEEGEYTSATHALTESPGGNYVPDESSFATLTTAMDWSTYLGAKMSFWCAYDIEAGFDYMYFEVTDDNGMTWTRLKTWDGEGVDWHQEFIELDAFVGSSQFNFRFLWVSDGAYEVNGMYIDDIEIVTYNSDVAPPLPVYTAPEFYEGTLGDFIDTVDVLDISAVAAVQVVWSVDGVAQTNIDATLVSGDEWTFTIPQQVPGSVIEFQFWAVDASANANEKLDTNVYTIVSGEHMIYDAGIVSYYNTTEDGDAKAVRVTVDASDATTTYGAQLAYLLIRNYADVSGHISDDMTVRVWQDEAGVPGTEVLTPITVTPEANTLANTSAMTMIDLKSEALTVYGDFWVGFSAPATGIVYSTQEATDETGTAAYNRSYDGASNGDGTWTWTEYTGTNYHFRAILGAATGIEEGNMPLTTALEQNYPNPFNPVTTINFTIAEEAKVSLVVYDVMGREVARLVDGNLAKGVHNVNFDAASLVSGVYYYNLKAGNVNQTKKMMLIK